MNAKCYSNIKTKMTNISNLFRFLTKHLSKFDEKTFLMRFDENSTKICRDLAKKHFVESTKKLS